jgi:predicted O-linked N-acetylglucosamine transferase (SPINDLY family)
MLKNAFSRKAPAPTEMSVGAASKLQIIIDRAVKCANAGDVVPAIECFREALKLAPASMEARHGLAAMLLQAGTLDEAYRLATGITLENPEFGDAWRVRAMAARDLGMLEDAVNAGEIAAGHRTDPGIMSFVGTAQFRQGKVAEAIASFERALQLDPLDDSVHSNRLFALASLHGGSSELVVKAHKDWGQSVERRVRVLDAPFKGDRSRDRPLRIGYVSADLRSHPVAALLEPILKHHNHDRYPVTCYDNHRGQADEVTERLRALSSNWRNVSRLNDRALARRIHEDAIDVLVDLSGHTSGNRLPMFAMRPAPVQVSWFGYMNTTGLSRMDYRFTHPLLSPAGSQIRYSETLFNLTGLVAWEPAADAPEPGEPPCLRNGYTTFGSFNYWSKITDDVIATWSQLLLQCKGSKLHIVAPGGHTPAVQESITARFGKNGVNANRLAITPTTGMREFLDKLKAVDISLDPYPYNGGTTSYHSLWMGVPFVSMATPGELGQTGYGLLNGVGLADLCATSPEGYVSNGLRLACDKKLLAELRGTLRQRFIATGLTDGDSVSRGVETAFRAMWFNFLDGKKSCLGEAV